MRKTMTISVPLDRLARELLAWCEAHPGDALPANMANAAQLLRDWTSTDWIDWINAENKKE